MSNTAFIPIDWSELENLERSLVVLLSQKINLTVERLGIVQEFYGDLETAFRKDFSELRVKHKWLLKLPTQTTESITTEIQTIQESLKKHDSCVYGFDEYPLNFEHLSDAPSVIYYRGNWNLIKSSSKITIVGSRNLNHYSESIVNKILKPALEMNQSLVTVSGLALGIDALAHQISLEAGIKTIGIVGSGLDKNSFYPSANWNLCENIINSDGLVISEYPPLTKATVYSFPRRNRLLACLSKLTWVVSASIKSGSLITARLANEFGNTVATTPANILDSNHLGNLELLKNGANIISEPQDILDLMNLNSYKINQISETIDLTFLSDDQKLVYEALGFESTNIDILSEKLSFETNYLISNLTLLELSGLAINTGENNWQKN